MRREYESTVRANQVSFKTECLLIALPASANVGWKDIVKLRRMDTDNA